MYTNIKKTIGIIGGLGPQATIDLYQRIINQTPAQKDQEHIPVLIYSLPQTPDRTQALLYGGETPLPYLVHAAQTLEKGGADVLAIACNTAHNYLKDIQKSVQIPIINMIEETHRYIKIQYKTVKKVGLLATTGTLRTNTYSTDIFSIITPESYIQEKCVMESIYGKRGIKAGNYGKHPKQLLNTAIQNLIEQGAEAIILGCTELPLVLKINSCIGLINPTEVLAKKCVNFALSYPKIQRDSLLISFAQI